MKTRDELLAALPAQEPVAWIRFASDGGYDGPIAAVDRRMDEIRKNSGAWTPLYTAPPDQTARIAALEAELAAVREDAERLNAIEGILNLNGYHIEIQKVRDPAIDSGMNRIQVRTGVNSGPHSRTFEAHSLRTAIDKTRES